MLKSIRRSLLLAGLLVVPALYPVAAQQPTEAERDAIRSACRSDFMAHCASVQPGGKEALECLLHNDSKLSAPCKSAVFAVAPKVEPKSESEPKSEPKLEPKPEPKSEVTKESAPKAPEGPVAGASKAAATQTQEDQIKAIRRACTLDDFMAHCSWISPSSPEVVLCLKANAAGLSPACRTAVGSLSNTTATPSPAKPARQERSATVPKKSEPTRASIPSPSSSMTAAANTGETPTSQQRNAIRAACRSDFISHCSGVQPGGTKAMQCLQRNAAQLSAPCKTAVAAIAGAATASPSAAPSESASPPPVAPLAPMPALRPREAVALLRICREDMQSLCAGIPSGGGRIISCLAEKASSLSPGCYGALAAARRY